METGEHNDLFGFTGQAVSVGAVEYFIKLAMVPHEKVVAYKEDPKNGLILYWSNSDPQIVNALLFEMDAEYTIAFVKKWLEKVHNSPELFYSYAGDPYDGDGDPLKGFSIICGYNEGQGWSGWSELCIIKPSWGFAGK